MAILMAGYGLCVVILAAFLLALRGRNQREHAAAVRDAVSSMVGALDADVPQHALLSEIADVLAGQESAALSLQQQVCDLLPGLPVPATNAAAAERLDWATALVTDVWGNSQALAGIREGFLRILAQPEPHRLVSSFVARQFDFSRDTLARPLMIVRHESAGLEADPFVLADTLRRYRTDIMADAARIFLTHAPEYSGESAEFHADRPGQLTAKAIFDAGIGNLPGHRRVSIAGDSAPSATAQAWPGKVRQEPKTPYPGPDLRVGDVFDFEPGSPWLVHAHAYLPFFAFVAAGIGELRLIDQACERLIGSQPYLRREMGVGGDSGTADAVRPVPLPGLHGSPSDLIGALIGSKITSIVRARTLTWRMADDNAIIFRSLGGVDSATRKLTDVLGQALDRERGAYLTEVGDVPRLDTVDRHEIRRVASGLHAASLLQVRLIRMLMTQAEAIERRSGMPGPGMEKLWAAVAAADEVVAASGASLAEGRCLRAVCDVLGMRLPLLPAGFPGCTYHREVLAQARPLAVLAVAHRMAVARWAAIALGAYFRRRHSLAASVCLGVEEYRRRHGELVTAINESIRTEGC